MFVLYLAVAFERKRGNLIFLLYSQYVVKIMFSFASLDGQDHITGIMLDDFNSAAGFSNYSCFIFYYKEI